MVISTPSVTSAPTLRPVKLFGPFRRILRAGDVFRSCSVGFAASAGLGISLRRRPSATCFAKSVSMFSRCETTRVRICERFHLAQFKGKRGSDVVLFDRPSDSSKTAVPGCSGRQRSLSGHAVWPPPPPRDTNESPARAIRADRCPSRSRNSAHS